MLSKFDVSQGKDDDEHGDGDENNEGWFKMSRWDIDLDVYMGGRMDRQIDSYFHKQIDY